MTRRRRIGMGHAGPGMDDGQQRTEQLADLPRLQPVRDCRSDGLVGVELPLGPSPVFVVPAVLAPILLPHAVGDLFYLRLAVGGDVLPLVATSDGPQLRQKP